MKFLSLESGSFAQLFAEEQECFLPEWLEPKLLDRLRLGLSGDIR